MALYPGHNIFHFWSFHLPFLNQSETNNHIWAVQMVSQSNGGSPFVGLLPAIMISFNVFGIISETEYVHNTFLSPFPIPDCAGPAYSQSPVVTRNLFIGGGHCYTRLVSSKDVADFLVKLTDFEPSTALSYTFATYTDGYYVDRVLDKNQGSIAVNISLKKLAPLLTVKDLTAIVKIHGIVIRKRDTKKMTIFKLL